MRRRFLRKLKDVVICSITVLAWYTTILSSASIADENKTAFITLAVSLVWIGLFIKANREVLE